MELGFLPLKGKHHVQDGVAIFLITLTRIMQSYPNHCRYFRRRRTVLKFLFSPVDLSTVHAISAELESRETFMRSILDGFVVIGLGLALAGVGFAQKPSNEHAPGRLLVQTVPGLSDADAAQAIAMAGAKVHHKIDGINVVVLEVPEAAVDGVSQALQRSGRFTFVERGFIAHAAAIPNDPDFLSEWHLAQKQAASAGRITTGSSGGPIAVIDL